MNNDSKQYEVVVVGGGFAGIEAVRTLVKKNLPIVITLVSSGSCFQYYPSLYRVVVGATANQVSVPLIKAIHSGVRLVEDTYTGIDQAAHTITLKSGKVLPYDYLVLALGSEANYFGIDGMEAQSKSFLSVEKALGLKEYFSTIIEKAKTLPKEEAQLQLRTIIVGAGPSGVELAGALPEYLKGIAKQYKISPRLIKVDLLDSSARVLPTIPPAGSAAVLKKLRKNGVTFYPNHGVNSCEDNCIVATEKTVAGEEKKHLQAGTIIWTAGTKINTAFATIPNVSMTERKRIQVSPTLTLPNDDLVYIAGDGSGTPYSGLAQTAIDQGAYVANAIAKRVMNEPVEPYIPKKGIFIIPVGKEWAILNYKDTVITGFIPWLLRIVVDLRYFLTITTVPYVLTMLKKKSQ
jgi:NADH dehydrogenase